MTPPPTLRTPRLALRPFTARDAADVRRLAGDRAVADTTLNIPHPYEIELAEAWIATHTGGEQAGTSRVFAITLADTGELVGAIGLTIDRRFDRAELGYWIGPGFWNRGYCTEAARAVVAHGFAALGLHRIHATHLTRNPASGRVMQKVGMTHEGRARDHVRKWDRFEDIERYGILAGEWAPDDD
jgi:[ribosomal protein S5]-alanine N-acetyltransferase